MPTIVIVDENGRTHEQLGTILLSQGYATFGFSGGHTALEGLAGVEPDVILVDMGIQEPSSFEFLAALLSARDTEQIPAILVSDSKRELDMDRAVDSGALDLLGIPMSPEDFLTVITAAIASGQDPIRMETHKDSA